MLLGMQDYDFTQILITFVQIFAQILPNFDQICPNPPFLPKKISALMSLNIIT